MDQERKVSIYPNSWKIPYWPMRIHFALAGDMQIEKYIPYSNCQLKLHITWASYTHRDRLNRLIGFKIKEYIILIY